MNHPGVPSRSLRSTLLVLSLVTMDLLTLLQLQASEERMLFDNVGGYMNIPSTTRSL